MEIVVGGQYTTRAGHRCVVLEKTEYSFLVWHTDLSSYASTIRHKLNGYVQEQTNMSDRDIVDYWEEPIVVNTVLNFDLEGDTIIHHSINNVNGCSLDYSVPLKITIHNKKITVVKEVT